MKHVNGSLKKALRGAGNIEFDEEHGIAYTHNSGKKWTPVCVLRVKDCLGGWWL